MLQMLLIKNNFSYIWGFRDPEYKTLIKAMNLHFKIFKLS